MKQFKKGVYGFVYDSCNGEVTHIYECKLSRDEARIISDSLPKNHTLFTELDNNLNEFFDFTSKEQLMNDTEGLNEVFEWID